MITETVVAGSLAKQLNLGSIVALLVVGMALGPHSPRPLLTGHVEELQTVGEIGVILLLFLVGLETKPERLSSMRRLLYGLGTAQYLLTTIAITGLLIAVAHLHWQSAFIMVLGLAMSSDVIAISILEEHAESAFRTPVPTKRCQRVSSCQPVSTTPVRPLRRVVPENGQR